MITLPLYWGPGRFGAPIVLVATTGGNNKTSDVVGMSVIPLETWHEVRATSPGKEAHQAYFYSVSGRIKGQRFKDRSEHAKVRSVCPLSCKHLQDGRCYVQDNYQNASNVAATVYHSEPLPAVWTADMMKQAARRLFMVAKMLGLDFVRFMFAGDTAALPVAVWDILEAELLAASMKTLAYTHDLTATWLRQTHMASCDTPQERAAAEADGWRVFEVRDLKAGEAWPDDLVMCPSSKEAEAKRGKKTPCNACGLCNGAQSSAKSIGIVRHASGDSGRFAATARKLGGVWDIKTDGGRHVGTIYA